MSSESNPFQRHTVTAALIYANGPIHIGHLAGCYLPSDIYVRYLRAKGEDVLFVSGTDEHGVPITLRARKEGLTPQEVVDKYYATIKQAFQDFGIEFDIYSRTSRPVHHQFSADFFLNLYNKGVFSEEVTEQFFDEEAKQFLADRYIMGQCPNCGNADAYGDQCEKCGTSLSPEELVEPRSTLSGSKPVRRATKNWFLPLDKMQPELENFIQSHDEWKSSVLGQCKSWLQAGLHPRAMTRDLEWGVKVPIAGADGKVLYVWFDAPIGYITASKEWFEEEAKRNPRTYAGGPRSENWELYWKDSHSRLIHFIGKDNIVFHCLIFPSMLMAHGGYILPDNVPANEFLNLDGRKISTSRNWAIWLHEYLEEMPGKQDELRYVLTAIAPESKDSDFTWTDFQARVDNELAAIFSNFVHRTLVLTHKNFEGKVPPCSQISEADRQLQIEMAAFPGRIGSALDDFRFREGLAELMNFARLGNKYLSDNEPWKLIKENPERAGTVLNLSLQIAACLAIVCKPFLPFTAEKLERMLALGPRVWGDGGRANLLPEGHTLHEPEMLFAKIDPKLLQFQLDKLEKIRKDLESAETPQSPKVAPAKSEATYEDFLKMDLRIGTVLSAEKVPNTDKLLQLKVDTGLDQRTIVSGVAHCFQPEDLVGKQVLVLANLAPRKIRGIVSQGMLLFAEDAEGKLHRMGPEGPISSGCTVA